MFVYQKLFESFKILSLSLVYDDDKILLRQADSVGALQLADDKPVSIMQMYFLLDDVAARKHAEQPGSCSPYLGLERDKKHA